MYRYIMLLMCLYFGAILAAQQRVDVDSGFPWGIHFITIPLILLVGIFIGWTLRDRKGFGRQSSPLDRYDDRKG